MAPFDGEGKGVRKKQEFEIFDFPVLVGADLDFLFQYYLQSKIKMIEKMLIWLDKVY
jgi:hypothetical protein